MLANDSLAPLFVGGTVYQAHLSPLGYHRWHSPVSGKVVKAYVKDGTYYSEAPAEGFDPAGPNDSQGYITAVATRAFTSSSIFTAKRRGLPRKIFTSIRVSPRSRRDDAPRRVVPAAQ